MAKKRKCYQHFLRYALYFQKAFSKGSFKVVTVWLTLPNNKILDWSKLEAFADDKINESEKLNLFWEG